MSSQPQQSDPTSAIAEQPVPAPTRPRVFKLNDYEWWAGYDLDSIRVAYKEETGVDPDSDEGFDNPQEISEDAMLRLQYCYDEYDLSKTRSFREELDLMISKGQTFPCFFGGTES